MAEQPRLDQRTFQKVCELIYNLAGIKLGAQKNALVSARIGKRMRILGLNDYKEYYNLVKDDRTGEEIVELLNTISTNVTHFFREEQHFRILDQLLKEWEAQGQRTFRIWCAAASTGEEPYSIAITIKEALRDSSETKILATDISTKALNIAREGLYKKRNVQKIPASILQKYFTKETVQGEVNYQAVSSLKKMLTFARLNLANPPFPMQGPFDVIFCRNVMIYFDNEVRRRLLAECYRLTKQGGYLIVGHAESLSGMLSNFKSVEPSVYIKS